jgi:hypothetical protein
VAEAANPTLLAETGGFLLGSAHRCGVAFERVERAGNAIHDFIVAAARDSSEAAVADSRFAEIFLASAPPQTKTRTRFCPGGDRAIRQARATPLKPAELTVHDAETVH